MFRSFSLRTPFDGLSAHPSFCYVFRRDLPRIRYTPMVCLSRPSRPSLSFLLDIVSLISRFRVDGGSMTVDCSVLHVQLYVKCYASLKKRGEARGKTAKVGFVSVLPTGQHTVKYALGVCGSQRKNGANEL